MKRSYLATTVLMGLLLVAGCLGAQKTSQAIPDHELGLSKGAVTEMIDPPAEMRNLSDPGDQPTTPADYSAQPPVVPHGVEEFLPITFDDNQCVECHAVNEKLAGEPTPIPASHYTDLRNSPEAAGEELVGARFNCVACHVSPGGNQALVGNSYRSGE